MNKIKKNRQYQRSKKRVLKYKIPGDREIAAMRIAFEVIMMAVQLQKEISQPVPRFPKGGIVSSEHSKEMVAGKIIQGPVNKNKPNNTPELIKSINEAFNKKI